jgi:hypothetical protein
MPWYEKLAQIVFSYNPHVWKSIQITDDHQIHYYTGLYDPNLSNIESVVVSKITDDDWYYEWKPRLDRIKNTNLQKQDFISNIRFEDVMVSIDDTIVYDEQYEEYS